MKLEQIKKINLESAEFEVLKEKIKSTGSKISAGSLINGLTNNCITEPQLQWLNENGNNISVGGDVEYSNKNTLKVLMKTKVHGKDNFICKQLVVAVDSDYVRKTTKNQLLKALRESVTKFNELCNTSLTAAAEKIAAHKSKISRTIAKHETICPECGSVVIKHDVTCTGYGTIRKNYDAQEKLCYNCIGE